MNKESYNYPLLDNEECGGDLRSIAEDVVYRVPAKDALEVRKAISVAAREFVKRTGLWKVRREAVPSDCNPGWYETCSGLGEGTPLRCDGVYFHNFSTITTDCAPNALQPDGNLPLPSFTGAVGDWDARDIEYRMGTGGRIVFRNRKMPLHTSVFGYADDEIGAAVSGFGDDETSLPEKVTIGKPVMYVVFTVGMAFGSEFLPDWIVRRYGDAIADGAAHILATGPTLQPTSWGVAFEGVIEELIAKMGSGGEMSSGETTSVPSYMEVI